MVCEGEIIESRIPRHAPLPLPSRPSSPAACCPFNDEPFEPDEKVSAAICEMCGNQGGSRHTIKAHSPPRGRLLLVSEGSAAGAPPSPGRDRANGSYGVKRRLGRRSGIEGRARIQPAWRPDGGRPPALRDLPRPGTPFHLGSISWEDGRSCAHFKRIPRMANRPPASIVFQYPLAHRAGLPRATRSSEWSTRVPSIRATGLGV